MNQIFMLLSLLISLATNVTFSSESVLLTHIDSHTFKKDRHLESALKEVFLSSFETVYKDEWTDQFKEYALQVFSRYIERFKTTDDMILVMASNESSVAGWALFDYHDQKAILELICVEPAFWRKGVGRKLVFSIRELLPDINHIAVVTRKANAISPHFYKSLGFKKTEFMLAEYEGQQMQGFEWLLK